ncbi:MAG: hypothetical protein M0Q42_03275 [Xanthomonadales bacterium]|nr:hypothetical protein [Xanthomonadales bacterium]
MPASATKISGDSSAKAFNGRWPAALNQDASAVCSSNRRPRDPPLFAEKQQFMFDLVYRNRVMPAWALLVGTGLAGAVAADTSPASIPEPPDLAEATAADFELAAVAGDTAYGVTPEAHVQHAYAQVLGVEPAFESVRVSRLIEYCRDPAPGNGVASLLAGLVDTAPAPGAHEPIADAHDASVDAPDPAADACELRREETVETQAVGYDVQYRYRGELFQSRLDEDPGDRLRIRVEITPAPAG